MTLSLGIEIDIALNMSNLNDILNALPLDTHIVTCTPTLTHTQTRTHTQTQIDSEFFFFNFNSSNWKRKNLNSISTFSIMYRETTPTFAATPYQMVREYGTVRRQIILLDCCCCVRFNNAFSVHFRFDYRLTNSAV